MATIVTRSGKGSPLTNTEVDSNFTNLNTDKVETGGTGLTKVGTTLNVDSSQPGITSLGTLTSLSLGDSSFLNIGAGNDLQLYHNSANSIILNNTGVFYIISAVGDMELRASGGDGGNDPYVILDASEGETKLNYVSS